MNEDILQSKPLVTSMTKPRLNAPKNRLTASTLESNGSSSSLYFFVFNIESSKENRVHGQRLLQHCYTEHFEVERPLFHYL